METPRNLPPSATADRFIVRFPDGMREAIKRRAAINMRSMTAEILFLITKGVEVTGGAENAQH